MLVSFLTDRCVGRCLTEWPRARGHSPAKSAGSNASRALQSRTDFQARDFGAGEREGVAELDGAAREIARNPPCDDRLVVGLRDVDDVDGRPVFRADLLHPRADGSIASPVPALVPDDGIIGEAGGAAAGGWSSLTE